MYGTDYLKPAEWRLRRASIESASNAIAQLVLYGEKIPSALYNLLNDYYGRLFDAPRDKKESERRQEADQWLDFFQRLFIQLKTQGHLDTSHVSVDDKYAYCESRITNMHPYAKNSGLIDQLYAVCKFEALCERHKILIPPELAETLRIFKYRGAQGNAMNIRD